MFYSLEHLTSLPHNWKSVRAYKSIPKLYHISFNSKLEGTWIPKNPDGEPGGIYVKYPEPDLPRISVAPTIRNCFMGIYPNISALFEKQNVPYVDFTVYNPIFKGSERIISPDELSKYRMVVDAHVTQEWCILDKVYMQNIGLVRVNNTYSDDAPFVKYTPFGDHTLPEVIELAPEEFDAKLLSSKAKIDLR